MWKTTIAAKERPVFYKITDASKPNDALHPKNRLDATTPRILDPVEPDLCISSPSQSFSRLVCNRSVEMLRGDLQSAKIPEETKEGAVDFDAPTVTYIANLAQFDTHPKLPRLSQGVATLN